MAGERERNAKDCIKRTCCGEYRSMFGFCCGRAWLLSGGDGCGRDWSARYGSCFLDNVESFRGEVSKQGIVLRLSGERSREVLSERSFILEQVDSAGFFFGFVEDPDFPVKTTHIGKSLSDRLAVGPVFRG